MVSSYHIQDTVPETVKQKTYVSLKSIFETEGWRSNRTFPRFYDKPILQEEQYSFSILNN